jgi:hypothetical protein
LGYSLEFVDVTKDYRSRPAPKRIGRGEKVRCALTSGARGAAPIRLPLCRRTRPLCCGARCTSPPRAGPRPTCRDEVQEQRPMRSPRSKGPQRRATRGTLGSGGPRGVGGRPPAQLPAVSDPSARSPSLTVRRKTPNYWRAAVRHVAKGRSISMAYSGVVALRKEHIEWHS